MSYKNFKYMNLKCKIAHTTVEIIIKLELHDSG